MKSKADKPKRPGTINKLWADFFWDWIDPKTFDDPADKFEMREVRRVYREEGLKSAMEQLDTRYDMLMVCAEDFWEWRAKRSEVKAS